MSTSLVCEDDAIEDRLNYFEWINQSNPTAADEADKHIEDTADLLMQNPFLGRESDDVDGVRVLIIRSLSLNIYYQENKNTIRIIRLLHQSRDISKLL